MDPPSASTTPALASTDSAPNEDTVPQIGHTDVTPLDAPPAQKTGAPGPGTLELTILGNYPNPWANDAVTEAQLATGLVHTPAGQDKNLVPHWSPATDTFQEVAHAERQGAGAVSVCANLDAMLNVIVGVPGSIARLNIITHGMAGGIGLSGSIKTSYGTQNGSKYGPGDVFFDTASEAFLTAALFNGVTGPREVQRKYARQRFGSGAAIFVYACDVGADHNLLQAMADFFQVTVYGFNAMVGFFPLTDSQTKPTKITDRSQTGAWDNTPGGDHKEPLFPPMNGFKHLNSEPPMDITSPIRPATAATP
jgi:hypothetical protein